jgi:hypothetical protein
VPYPPESARRVDHASNPAAPWLAAISANQIFRWRAVSYEPRPAGLTEEFRIAGGAGEIFSVEGEASSFAFTAGDFATGASGWWGRLRESSAEALVFAAITATGAGEFAGPAGVSRAVAVQQTTRKAVKNKNHLSSCRVGGGRSEWLPLFNTVAVPWDRVTGPLVTFRIVLLTAYEPGEVCTLVPLDARRASVIVIPAIIPRIKPFVARGLLQLWLWRIW